MTIEEKIATRIDELKKEIKDIEVELQQFDILRQRQQELQMLLDEVSNLLGLESSKEMPAKTSHRTIFPGKDYFDETERRSARKACLKVINDNIDKFFSSAEMATELLNHGYQTTAKDFKQSIGTTLSGLANEKLIRYKSGKMNMKYYTSLKSKQDEDEIRLLN